MWTIESEGVIYTVYPVENKEDLLLAIEAEQRDGDVIASIKCIKCGCSLYADPVNYECWFDEPWLCPRCGNPRN